MLHSDDNRLLTTILAGLVFLLLGWASAAWASSSGKTIQRYEHSGDGIIRLVSEKNGRSFAGAYRSGPDRYDPKALKAIDRLFDAHPDDPLSTISLRLIEFLDFLEDQLRPGARIAIVSGYRAPEYNTGLRNRGGLAAKASLHQYGMAADIKIEGVAALSVWNYVKQLKFGGAGYYHGVSVHIDVGPARFWDETTTGVGTDISDHNKVIGLVADFDRYRPGESIGMRFIRMTAFPIGIRSSFVLERSAKGQAVADIAVFKPTFSTAADPGCPQFSTVDAMMGITWRLPDDLAPGTYRIRAVFCNRLWQDMPADTATPDFTLVP